jgi:hypothetical protein
MSSVGEATTRRSQNHCNLLQLHVAAADGWKAHANMTCSMKTVPSAYRHFLARIFIAAIASLTLLVAGKPARAESTTPVSAADADLEKRVKAAYLFKFADYVEWPKESFPAAESPFTIAVLDDGQFAASLAQVTSGRTVGGRRIEVRLVKPGEALTGVQALFIDHSTLTQLGQSVERMRPKSLLIVTDAPNALAQGSVINFQIIDGKVRFEVALDNASRRGLKLSSRLLAVAQSVRGMGS